MPDKPPNDETARTFTRALLQDLRALERMVADGAMDEGLHRMGAEQELVLVDERRRPAPIAAAILAELDDPRLTTELARFNLEINVPPHPAGLSVLSEMESELGELLSRVDEAAARRSAKVVLTGIMPCLSQRDLTVENMTPGERYQELNDVIMRLAGGRVLLHVTGTDELRVEHDSVMLEACNTSFQVHLQVDGKECVPYYNAAQAMIAPVLAAATNSPFLFGKRLWAETRIAVFRQSIDTRASSPALRELTPRVRFGDRWVRDSVVELFEEDITRFPVVMTREPDEDPLSVLDAGGVPELRCLQLHNSTVYRWNRPCYGITDGRPHLRIESRALPSGPTLLDEMANAALWLGLLSGGANRFPDLPERLDFADAKANFFAAARRGLDTRFHWIDGETVAAHALLLERLIPLAHDGLVALGVSDAEARRYLDVIVRRVERGQTGSRWLQRSAVSMAGVATRPERCAALTSALIARRESGRPVHEWELARIDEGVGTTGPTVDQYMTTSLLTVQQDETVDLAAFIMDREQTRQILVENQDFELVGLISYRSLLRLLASGDVNDLKRSVPVREIMVRDPVTIPPDAPVSEAIQVMKRHGVSCLPVVETGKLVGILTEHDFMPLASELLQRSFEP
jgi:CBS domain-containing protein